MSEAPTEGTARLLEAQVQRLVRGQTNIFIRELLRSLGYKPGANKDEFTAALKEAIRAGKLTQQKLNDWLRSVEGWGNQHIYVHEVPTSVKDHSIWNDEGQVAAMVERAASHTWRTETSTSFPEKPELVHTDFDPERGLFSAEWHEKTATWARAKERDREDVEIDGDTYWFRAYRHEPGRSVMRFALWLRPTVARRPISGLFLRYPVRTKEHRAAIGLAWQDLERFALAGGQVSLETVRSRPWSLSRVIKRLDQQIVHDEQRQIRSKSATFSEGQASVTFVSPPDLTLPGIIRDVRLSLPDQAIEDPDLEGTAGEFHLARDPQRSTSREARVELFQSDNRIRIWTELEERDVWAILQAFEPLQAPKPLS